MAVKVLVADDDPEMLEVLAEAVKRPGVAVLQASTGGELLDRLAEEGPFDLIVTDISMPWMSGLQVANSARTAGVGTPVIVVTGDKDPTLDDQVSALGGHVRLLRKPVALHDLEEAVEAALMSRPEDLHA